MFIFFKRFQNLNFFSCAGKRAMSTTVLNKSKNGAASTGLSIACFAESYAGAKNISVLLASVPAATSAVRRDCTAFYVGALELAVVHRPACSNSDA